MKDFYPIKKQKKSIKKELDLRGGPDENRSKTETH